MRYTHSELNESRRDDLPKTAATIWDTWRFRPESSAVFSERVFSACSARFTNAAFSSAHAFRSASNSVFSFSCAAMLDTNLAFAFRVSISCIFGRFLRSARSASSFLPAACINVRVRA